MLYHILNNNHGQVYDSFNGLVDTWRYPQEIQAFQAKLQSYFQWASLKQDRRSKDEATLAWADDKGLEIYNTATWEDEADQFKLKPIVKKFEAYTKPQ